MIINGKINPPIGDALITLKFPDNPALGNLETKSDQSGSFKFGPLDGSLNVELTAFKESYVFSEYDKASQLFKAHKLCEIIAVVRDEQKNLLPGVKQFFFTVAMNSFKIGSFVIPGTLIVVWSGKLS